MRNVLILVAGLFLAGGAFAQEITKGGGKGKPHFVFAKREGPQASMIIEFPVGSVHDGVEYGLTRVAQYLLVENSVSGGGDFLQDVYDIGGTFEVRTSVTKAQFYLTAPKSAFTRLSDRLMQMTFRPNTQERELDTAKDRTLNRVLLSGGWEDLIGYLAGKLSMGANNSGGDYRNPPFGKPKAIRGFEFEVVKAHIEKHFRPGAATVYVAGNTSLGRFRKSVQKYKGGNRPESYRPPMIQLPTLVKRRAARDFHGELRVTEIKSAEDVAVARILAELINDRVMWSLRRKGEVYSTSTRAFSYDWLDFILLVIPISTTNEAAVNRNVEILLRDLAAGKYSDEELESARGAALSSFENQDRNSEQLVVALSSARDGVDWHSAKVKAAMSKVDRAALKSRSSWLDESQSVRIAFGRGVR